MGDAANNALNYFCRRFDYEVKPKHDRRRHRVLKCPTCGAGPLQFLEEARDQWVLAEFGDDNKLTRHVCKMKFGTRAGR